jgi:branched-chain amino acid transport system ATP-binding protein
MMLTVSDLGADYGAIRAVTDLSIAVGAGKMVAILGANGAGKSTTLRSIAGLHRPVRGSIKLDGEEISTMPVHRVVRRGL